MAEVSTAKQLLINALQDLRAAEVLLGKRLPKIAGKTDDDALRTAFDEYASAGRIAAAEIGDAIEALGGERDGPSNIWMKGVLDDAKRDTKSVAAGHWRDVALVGALRKGAQAARVSYETAVALAATIGDDDARSLAERLRNAHADFDARLAESLGPLAEQPRDADVNPG